MAGRVVGFLDFLISVAVQSGVWYNLNIVADGIGIFPPPLLPDVRQRVQSRFPAWGIVHRLEVRRELLQVAIVMSLKPSLRRV